MVTFLSWLAEISIETISVTMNIPTSEVTHSKHEQIVQCFPGMDLKQGGGLWFMRIKITQ